jgi:hypothetical protein
MPIKRYNATKDNTISNAFKGDLITRATGSNTGLSDVLETFVIYGQAASSSIEKARILIQFDTDQMTTDRAAGTLPSVGNVNYYLRMFNAAHGFSLPRNYNLEIRTVSGSWDEGRGLDLDDYSDSDFSNWISASSTAGWVSQGGDFHATPAYSQSYGVDGTEDLEVDVTTVVEQWLAGTKENNGLLIKISGSAESAPTTSLYTKRFFSRSSEYFYKRPVIEARFSSTKKDKRANFFYSSSLSTAAENLNTIYFYNYHRGILRNIPAVGTGNVYVSLFSGSTSPTGSALTLVADGTYVTAGSPTVVTGGWVSTGVYSASFAITAATTPLETIFDVWHNGNLTTQYFTGSIEPQIITGESSVDADSFTTQITNLKPTYTRGQTERFRVYARLRNWTPTVYTVATATPVASIIESGSYKIYRVIDDLDVISYGTGSTQHTALSYDSEGNYFDLDMNLFEAGYSYAVKFSYYNGSVGSYVEQPETFKFRVE